MGDLNQVAYLKKHRHLVRGPILEIGSKDYGNTPDYRTLFQGESFIGADLFEGKGVDLVADLSEEFKKVQEKIGGQKFNTIICFSVLEHCPKVFQLCDNLSRFLNTGGRIFISAPFSWEYHAFPDDYWRFSPSGIRVLFPALEFDETLTMISTSNVGEIVPLKDKEFFKIDLAPGVGIKKKRYSFAAGLWIKVLKTFGIMKEVLNHIYVLPPVNINMIGIKKQDV